MTIEAEAGQWAYRHLKTPLGAARAVRIGGYKRWRWNLKSSVTLRRLPQRVVTCHGLARHGEGETEDDFDGGGQHHGEGGGALRGAEGGARLNAKQNLVKTLVHT